MKPELYIFDGPSYNDTITLFESEYHDFDLVYTNQGGSGKGVRFTIWGEALQKKNIDIETNILFNATSHLLEKENDEEGNPFFFFELKDHQILDGYDNMELATQWMIPLKFRIYGKLKGCFDLFFDFQPLTNINHGSEALKVRLIIK